MIDNNPLTMGENSFAWFPIHFTESMERWTSPEEVNKATFRTIDEDNDGSVSIDEMNKFMISAGYILTVYELQLLMQELDTNRDGKINYNEMLKMMDAECLEPQIRIESPNQFTVCFSISECYKIVLKRFSKVDVFCHSNCAILVSHQNCLLVVSYSDVVWSFLIDLTLVYIASTCISICRGQLSGISSVSGI